VLVNGGLTKPNEPMRRAEDAGNMVGNGKPATHQTKSTNGIRSVSEDLGRDW